jgi:hypothetical protein
VFRQSTGSTNRQPPPNRTDASRTGPPSRGQNPERRPRPKRRPLNIEGAFPLLLVGSVLLVYCALLRNETLNAQGTHLPLWGLIGAVGAVIVGSGVYSVLLNPPKSPAPAAPEGFVMVPKTEWEAARSGPRPGARSAPTTTAAPPWWEGPHAYPGTPPVSPASPTSTRAAPIPPARAVRHLPPASSSSQKSPGGGPGVTSAPRASPLPVPALGPTPSSPRRASLNELKETLTELEAVVSTTFKPAPRRPPNAERQERPTCTDCGRWLPRDRAPIRCADCGKELCVDCALSSQFEDADLRCDKCRARRP